MLNQAAENYMKDGLLTDDEQQRIDEFMTTFNISITNLPAKYQGLEIFYLMLLSKSDAVVSCILV
jgi:hypothetical protein